MSEYWKSTPTYWCKFCAQYVRDTTIERKNHEASGKHQNNIQRSLRELHKSKERDERDKQRAKDEVARLNGLVSGTRPNGAPSGSRPKTQPGPLPSLTTAQQRRAHAEQLAALGVALPEELKKEVTGVGDYHVVNAREVEDNRTQTVNRSLADILAEAKRDEQAEGIKKEEDEDDKDAISQAERKRKAEDEDEDPRDEEAAPRRKIWGSSVKTYPGSERATEDTGDLDDLLSGVKKKPVKIEKPDDLDRIKKEESADEVRTKEGAAESKLDAVLDIKNEQDPDDHAATIDAPPVVVFKKRKVKK